MANNKQKFWVRFMCIALAAVMGIFFFKGFVLRRGLPLADKVPERLSILLQWGFCTFAVFFCLLVAADLVRLARRMYRKLGHHRDTSRRGFDNAVNLALLAAAAMIAAQGAVNARAVPELCETEIHCRELPPGLDGSKIVLLADLHVDKFTPPEFIPALVRRVNALEPDLVAIAGDFADGKVADFAPRIAGLKNLRARYGVFGVPGNHEYLTSYRPCMAQLRSMQSATLAAGMVLNCSMTSGSGSSRRR